MKSLIYSASFLSVILLIINYRITFKISAQAHSDFLRTRIDENGYPEENPNYDRIINKTNEDRKWISRREIASIIFSIISMIAVFVIIFQKIDP